MITAAVLAAFALVILILHLFRQRRRQWRLSYTFLPQGQAVRETDHFLTQAEAEERFGAMWRDHARLRQPILHAQLTGPKGVQKNLLAAPLPI